MTLIATVLEDAVIKVRNRSTFNDFETRRPIFGALEAHRLDTNQLVPAAEIEAARISKGRPVKLPVLKKYDATLKTAYTCAFDPDAVESAFVTPTWATIGFDISREGAINADNYIEAADDLAHQIEMGLQMIGKTLDTAAVSNLNASKTAVNASTLYPVVGNTMQVSAADQLNFYKKIGSIMRRNDLDLPVMDISNTESEIDFTFIGQQGAANDVNRAYQIGGILPFRSNRVATASGVAETHYLVPRGSLGMLTWIPYDFRIGSIINEGEYWSTQVDPLFGFTWAVRYKRSCVDSSGTYTRQTPASMREEWSFRMDYSYLSSYSSDTSSPIFKAEILEPSAS
jgi:hypothetical protein